MIFVTGDVHGHFRSTSSRLGSKNFPEGKDLTKDDYVIVVGDFGWLWFPEGSVNYKKDQYGIKWLEEKPWTTLFVDGNHENFDMLDKLEEVDFCGGRAGKVNDSLYHLKRGEVFLLNDKKVFVFGGAESSKTFKRGVPEQVEGKNWWAREIYADHELENALRNLQLHNNEVDYVLTHTAPIEVVTELVKQLDCYEKRKSDPVAVMLSELDVNFKEWYFGHFHDNLTFLDKYHLVFDKIRELK